MFDTVAAMNGIQRPGEDVATDVLFENGSLHKDIRRAVHIVALDEDRTLFAPTLINRDDGELNRITEVWFPGVHGDIGGGYWHDGLSDVALRYMILQCEDASHAKGKFKLFRTADKDIQSQMKNLGSEEEMHGIHADDVAIHPLTKGPLHRHSGPLVRMGGRQPRKVRVNRNDETSNELPCVHESVKERFRDVADYRPVALRGLQYRLVDDFGAAQPGKLNGISGLRANAKDTIYVRDH